MCTRNKDNEWYIYLRNKDTVSQSLPQPGGMTQIHFSKIAVKMAQNTGDTTFKLKIHWTKSSDLKNTGKQIIQKN